MLHAHAFNYLQLEVLLGRTSRCRLKVVPDRLLERERERERERESIATKQDKGRVALPVDSMEIYSFRWCFDRVCARYRDAGASRPRPTPSCLFIDD